MIIRWLLASLHLLALGIGLGAGWARGYALRGELDQAGLRRVFLADGWWGLAAVLWIATGLVRAFGGFEKGSSYYLNNYVFLIKMGLLVLIFLLEIRPMLKLSQWRTRLRSGELPDTTSAKTLATISFVQCVLVILMVFAATAMARGFGMR